jgi:hypothetical protein
MAFTYDGSGNAVLPAGGTAAVPAIRIGNDNNSGLFSPADNFVNISSDGNVKVSVRPNETMVFNDIMPQSYREVPFFVGPSGSAKTLTARSFQVTSLSANCTFTLPSPRANSGRGITLLVKSGTTGGFTATFVSSAGTGTSNAAGNVRWPGGVAPTMTSAANKMDIFSFVTDGDYWYCTAVQNFSYTTPA